MINNEISYRSTCSSGLVRYLSITSRRACIACSRVRGHNNCVNYSKCDGIVSFMVGEMKMFRVPVVFWLAKMSAIVLATL